MGVILHEYDVDLTDYAVANIVQYFSDQDFARRIFRDVRTPALVDYLQARSDEGNDTPQVRLLFSDAEMEELASACDVDPDGGLRNWSRHDHLHRRYIQTITEVREGLSRQVAEVWSEECSAFARRLETDGLLLHEGIEIVCDWVERLRALQLAMGAAQFVPPADQPRQITPPTESDPRYPGLTQAEICDIETMRGAIAQRADGREAKPDTLTAAVGIRKQKARRALRWLEAHGEYQGFARRPSNR